MNLADTLREALTLGHQRSPTLLPGDSRDPVTDEEQPVTPAAVLVAVVDRPEPTVILTVRTETVRRHAGQVAFPGGRIDPEDDGPIAASIREAFEEIALPPETVEVIGIADRYRTVTGYEVTPAVQPEGERAALPFALACQLHRKKGRVLDIDVELLHRGDEDKSPVRFAPEDAGEEPHHRRPADRRSFVEPGAVARDPHRAMAAMRGIPARHRRRLPCFGEAPHRPMEARERPVRVGGGRIELDRSS